MKQFERTLCGQQKDEHVQKLRQWLLPTSTQNRHGVMNRRQFFATATALGMSAGVAAQTGRLPEWSNRLPEDMRAGPLGLNSGVSETVD